MRLGRPTWSVENLTTLGKGHTNLGVCVGGRIQEKNKQRQRGRVSSSNIPIIHSLAFQSSKHTKDVSEDSTEQWFGNSANLLGAITQINQECWCKIQHIGFLIKRNVLLKYLLHLYFSNCCRENSSAWSIWRCWGFMARKRNLITLHLFLESS